MTHDNAFSSEVRLIDEKLRQNIEAEDKQRGGRKHTSTGARSGPAAARRAVRPSVAVSVFRDRLLLSMGNSASSGRAQDETVDFGALVPQGVYTGPRDWAHQVVAQAIVDRRLAPFYRPLEDYEEGWSDDQILAARKEPPPPPPETDEPEGSARQSHAPAPAHHHKAHGKKASTTGKGKEQATLNEASLYHGAVECPICFLVRAGPPWRGR
jgi:hypothetical protein